MKNSYNEKLFNKYKKNICLYSSKNIMQEDDCSILYIKKNKVVKSIEDIIVVGIISHFKDETLNSRERIVKSVSIPNFGNILYAFSIMELTARGKSLTASNETTESARSVWKNICNNDNYKKEKYIIAEEILVEARLESDENYLIALKNNTNSELTKEIEKDLKDKSEQLFWNAYESKDNKSKKDLDVLNRLSYLDNNFKKIDNHLKSKNKKKYKF